MKFIELAEKRCSIRGFASDPVPDEVLREILQAGALAPSAKNLQPYHFVVVRAESGLDVLAQAYAAPFFREAPVVVVICTEVAKGWVRDRYDGKSYCDVDAAIAIDHMTLAAADNGLATCWIGAFDPVLVSNALGLPAGVEPLAMLPIGVPRAEPREKVRKSIDELVHEERWKFIPL
jgi:nitroreductase